MTRIPLVFTMMLVNLSRPGLSAKLVKLLRGSSLWIISHIRPVTVSRYYITAANLTSYILVDGLRKYTSV